MSEGPKGCLAKGFQGWVWLEKELPGSMVEGQAWEGRRGLESQLSQGAKIHK